jgi:hypothetical protein
MAAKERKDHKGNYLSPPALTHGVLRPEARLVTEFPFFALLVFFCGHFGCRF